MINDNMDYLLSNSEVVTRGDNHQHNRPHELRIKIKMDQTDVSICHNNVASKFCNFIILLGGLSRAGITGIEWPINHSVG